MRVLLRLSDYNREFFTEVPFRINLKDEFYLDEFLNQKKIDRSLGKETYEIIMKEQPIFKVVSVLISKDFTGVYQICYLEK